MGDINDSGPFSFFPCLFTSQITIFHSQRCPARTKFSLPDAVCRGWIYERVLAWYRDVWQEKGFLLSLVGISTKSMLIGFLWTLPMVFIIITNEG